MDKERVEKRIEDGVRGIWCLEIGKVGRIVKDRRRRS